MESWDTFTVVIGGSSAALLGLLFVAISIRVGIVAASAELRNRAAQTLVLFGIVLLLSVLLAVPRQPYLVLGLEVILLAVLSGVGLTLLDRRAGGPGSRPGIGRVLDAIAPNTLTPLLLLAAGVLLAFGLEAGLYVLVLPVIAAFAAGLASAWLFMTRLDGPAPVPPPPAEGR